MRYNIGDKVYLYKNRDKSFKVIEIWAIVPPNTFPKDVYKRNDINKKYSFRHKVEKVRDHESYLVIEKIYNDCAHAKDRIYWPFVQNLSKISKVKTDCH